MSLRRCWNECFPPSDSQTLPAEAETAVKKSMKKAKWVAQREFSWAGAPPPLSLLFHAACSSQDKRSFCTCSIFQTIESGHDSFVHPHGSLVSQMCVAPLHDIICNFWGMHLSMFAISLFFSWVRSAPPALVPFLFSLFF